MNWKIKAIATMLMLFIGSAAPGAESSAMDGLLAKITQYDYGQSREPLNAIADVTMAGRESAIGSGGWTGGLGGAFQGKYFWVVLGRKNRRIPTNVAKPAVTTMGVPMMKGQGLGSYNGFS